MKLFPVSKPNITLLHHVLYGFVCALAFILTLLLQGCPEETSNDTSNSLKNSSLITNIGETLIITDAYIDANHNLIITGRNFNSGSLAVPAVNLDGTVLNIIEHSDTEIVAAIADDLDIDTIYLLTVTTGSELNNYDTYALFHVDEVPSSAVNNLLIVSVETEKEPAQIKLNIEGYNYGLSPSTAKVTINGIELVIDASNSHSEKLVAIVPFNITQTILGIDDNLVLQVQTGSINEQYDAYPLFKGMFENNPPILACNRSDLDKVPTAGEHCCTTSGQTLCWRTGPIREDIKNFLFHYDEIPRYFELTEDYVFPIAHYFDDPPPVAFPTFWRVNGDGDPATKRQRLVDAGLLLELPLLFSTKIEPIINNRKWDFVDYVDGSLIIKKGYRWDGASIGIDFNEWDDRLRRTYLVNMRSSLVHDVFYDLIRFCDDTDGDIGLTCDTTGKAPRNDGKEDYRDLADTLFYLTAKEDGQTSKLKTFYKTLRRLGQTKARLDPEYKTGWRYHTLANASASYLRYPIDETDKTLNLECATLDDFIDLDAGNSFPIAIAPKVGTHQPDLHSTYWQWTLDGKLLFEDDHNFQTGDLNLQPEKFITRINVIDLINDGLTTGINHLLKLHVDKGKNTDEAEFETTDDINLMVDLDTQPPIIEGITEAIIEWPPNHKYKTFYIKDFVYSVADNCTSLSIDDLVITEVSSNEANDVKFGSHDRNDIIIANNGKSVKLRIERDGKGDGRVYTVYIQAIDKNDNIQIANYEVVIPHDMGLK